MCQVHKVYITTTFPYLHKKNGNSGLFSVDRKHMRAVDRKQEIYLEWPYGGTAKID